MSNLGDGNLTRPLIASDEESDLGGSAVAGLSDELSAGHTDRAAGGGGPLDAGDRD